MRVYRHRLALLCEECAAKVMPRLSAEELRDVHVVEHVSPEKLCGMCLRPLHPEGGFGREEER